MSILFCGIVGCCGAVAVRGVSRFFNLSIQHPISYSVLALCIIGGMFSGLFLNMWINILCGLALFGSLVVLFIVCCQFCFCVALQCGDAGFCSFFRGPAFVLSGLHYLPRAGS